MGFREYFKTQATLADELYEHGYKINCYITATAAIDALSEIWKSDFPAEAAALDAQFGGKAPSAVRMGRFVRRFSGDDRSNRIAVIRFAEDAARFAPAIAPAEVAAMLKARAPKGRALPPAHLDVDLADLANEAPTLLGNPVVRRIAEEYHYPSLLYSLYRCPTVHTFGWSRESQGYVRGDEVMYMRLHDDITSIGFGPQLVTAWLVAALGGYLAHCDSAKVEPAGSIDPGVKQERRLRAKWTKA